jgi:hypothetical protein
MPNITLSISAELYHHARICAARRDLSISALVRKFLQSLMEKPHHSAASRVRVLKKPRTPLPPLF